MSVTLCQIVLAYLVRDASWSTILVLGYVISGTCNQNLFCAQHELSHFLALKNPAHNKIISILSNCPLVVPSATTFRKYHQEHHSHLVTTACSFSAICCLSCPWHRQLRPSTKFTRSTIHTWCPLLAYSSHFAAVVFPVRYSHPVTIA